MSNGPIDIAVIFVYLFPAGAAWVRSPPVASRLFSVCHSPYPAQWLGFIRLAVSGVLFLRRPCYKRAMNPKLADKPNSPLVDAALARTLPGVSPAGLLEAIENADAITGTARGFLYIQLHTLQQLANSHTFTVSHRLQYATL